MPFYRSAVAYDHRARVIKPTAGINYQYHFVGPAAGKICICCTVSVNRHKDASRLVASNSLFLNQSDWNSPDRQAKELPECR